MDPLAIPLVGQQLQTPEWAITQYISGDGSTYAWSNNIATITMAAAHGLTFTPAAGVPANYFVLISGSTSGLSGTGILVGNIFRILSIPTTTEITIYTTVSAATITSMTLTPVFFPPFAANPAYAASAGVPALGAALMNVAFGANCTMQYNPDQTFIALDAVTTYQLGATPATAPTWRTIVAASGAAQVYGAYPTTAIMAGGTTATSHVSVGI